MDCGPWQFDIVKSDDTSIDTSVFTFTPGTTHTLEGYTEDSTKATTYNYKIKVWYIDHPTVGASRDFTIVVTDTCEAPSLTASTLPNFVYTIYSGTDSTPAFASFLNSPSFCPENYVLTSISPALPSDGVSSITLDPVTRVFSYGSTNPAAEATYTVTAAY